MAAAQPSPPTARAPVVATFFGADDDVVLREGHAWAQRLNARLHVVHPIAPQATPSTLDAMLPAPTLEERRTAAARLLARRLDDLFADSSDIATTIIEGRGDRAPLEFLRHLTPHPQLLVTHAETSLWRRLLGHDPVHAFVSRAPCSVLAASRPRSGPIVAAGYTDDELRVAAFAAAAEATRRGRPLEVVRLQSIGMPAGTPRLATSLGLPSNPVAPKAPHVEHVEPSDDAWLHEALDRLGRSVDVRTITGSSGVLAEHLEETDATLLVVTERERSRWSALLSPTDAPGMIRRAPCSVLVVRPELDSSP